MNQPFAVVSSKAFSLFAIATLVGCSVAAPPAGGERDALADANGVSEDAVSVGPSCANVANCRGESTVIPGGSFTMEKGLKTAHPASVGTFRLDTYEVTIARFRKFVEAYPASRPKVGDGANPAIAGSGWKASFDKHLPATQAELRRTIGQYPDYSWTDKASTIENRALRGISWYHAAAFCAWDEGRLPTEAEWEYAAVGGSEGRVYPWGKDVIGELGDYIVDDSWSLQTADGYRTHPTRKVGSMPKGRARWGQYDMQGNASEWVLDVYEDHTAASRCVNCAQLNETPYRMDRTSTPTVLRVLRGSDSSNIVDELARNNYRGVGGVGDRGGEYTLAGVRCARKP